MDTLRSRVESANRISHEEVESMVILCILIFLFAVLAELMKMNNGGGRKR